MKRIFFITSLVTIITFTCHAQTSVGFSIRPSLPVSKVALPGFSNIDANGNEEVVLATLGAGIAGNLTIETRISKHISLGLTIEQFKSFEGELVKNNPADGTIATIAFKAKSTNILPTVMIHAGDKGFYSKFGFMLALNPALNSTITIENAGLTGASEYEYTDNSSLGYIAGFGINKNISDKMGWFAELTLVNYVHRPDLLIHKRNFDGLDTDPNIEYVSERNLVTDENKELTFPIPYHNIGLNLGIKYKL